MDRLLKPADVDRLAQLADEQGLTALTSAEQGQLAAERPDEFHLAFERGLAA